MAQRTTVNQIAGPRTGGGGYIIVTSDVTGYLNLNGGTFPANAAGETVEEMHISKVTYGTGANTHWVVKRGGNTVAVLNGTGVIDFQEERIRVEGGGDAISNLVFTKTGASDAHLAIKLHKKSGSVGS